MKKATKTVTAFAVLTLFAGSSHAAILNAGFETAGGGGSFPQAASWGGSARLAPHSSFGPGSFSPGNTRFAFTETFTTQTLTDTFQANTTYTFQGYSVKNGATSDIGFRLGYDNGGGFVELNEATYDREELDAWTLLDGVTYSTGASGTELSEQIIVRIDIVNPAGPNPGIWFDEVSLTAVPVPEPSSLALLGLGGLSVLRRRRQA